MSDNSQKRNDTSKKYNEYNTKKRDYSEVTAKIYSHIQSNQKIINSLTEQMRQEAGVSK